jgi:hypothetical protein
VKEIRVCHFEIEKCEDCKFFYVYPNAFTVRGYTLLCRNPDRLQLKYASGQEKWGSGQILEADRKRFPQYCPLLQKNSTPEQWLTSGSDQEDNLNTR